MEWDGEARGRCRSRIDWLRVWFQTTRQYEQYKHEEHSSKRREELPQYRSRIGDGGRQRREKDHVGMVEEADSEAVRRNTGGGSSKTAGRKSGADEFDTGNSRRTP